jgi:hypothetical protein
MAAPAPTARPLARQTTDLRGAAATSAARGTAVLADPTGRRARRMRLAGRLVVVAFTLWLCALMIAGLDLLPSGSVPLAHRIHAGPAPQSRSREDPVVARAGTPAALVPAMASGPAARALLGTPARHAIRLASGHAPSRTPKGTAARKRPVLGTVPLATVTPRARNPHAATPGATANPKPGHGKSGTAPGQTRTARGLDAHRDRHPRTHADA